FCHPSRSGGSACQFVSTYTRGAPPLPGFHPARVGYHHTAFAVAFLSVILRAAEDLLVNSFPHTLGVPHPCRGFIRQGWDTTTPLLLLPFFLSSFAQRRICLSIRFHIHSGCPILAGVSSDKGGIPPHRFCCCLSFCHPSRSGGSACQFVSTYTRGAPSLPGFRPTRVGYHHTAFVVAFLSVIL